ncbi:uncharacterized protein LOC120084950 [Benincasa hispida]|uniref:uncharacterized protein LOC120084950 n=1 Tax=Benincasa hispida TaxID=102211 RepID=UPI001901C50A|nr:uncharacterized protein LOC120084950 [Benincasa hispida]
MQEYEEIAKEERLNEMVSEPEFSSDIMLKKNKFKKYEIIGLIEECSAMLQKKLPQKLKDPGSFTIPYTIGSLIIARALCDLGIIEDALVKTDKFVFPVDFKVLDMEEDSEISIILDCPLLATGRALIDVQKGE